MARGLLNSIFIFLFVVVSGLYANARSTFGAEFTFTNDQILAAQQGSYVNSDASEAHREKMAEAVRRTCGNCTITREQNSYGVDTLRVTYPDGFYFLIATDPAVVEVQTKPATTSDLRRQAGRMARDIFGAAKAAGMAPSERGTGGGHIHIGYHSSTGGDLLLMRNILVDFANHPELANGILAHDHWNSQPIQALPQENQEAFKKIIEDFDRGQIRDIVTFANRIQDEVYNWHRANWSPPKKYQAFNVTRLADLKWAPEERTFEIRSIKPQRSLAEYLALTNLLEGRIEYLRTKKSPVPLRIPGTMTPRQGYESFARFSAEAGIDFGRFRQIMKLGSVANAVAVQTPKLLCFKLFVD
jgi:hypothetical protein